MDSLEISSVVAGYRIDGVLGEGGMGAVYRATQLSLERVVALKVLTAELSADPSFRERFRREGLLQAALEHPNIVTVYEAGTTDDRLFLAMQMIDGPTLKTLILERQLGDRRAVRLLTQVAGALDAAHAQGLIHRDVKPQNVLVGRGEHAYLADFGLTRGSDDVRMTATGLFVGTIDYISPEQARGEGATRRTDVYALAAVLYECLTGTAPFVRASEERVLLAHLSEQPPAISRARQDLPPALDDVIARGMAKDPDERPGSARELMSDVRRALGSLPSPAGEGPSATRIGSIPENHPAAPVDATRRGAAQPGAFDTSPLPGPGAPVGAPLAGPGAPGTTRVPQVAPQQSPAQAPRAPGAPPAKAGPGRAGLVVVIVAAVLAAVVGVLVGRGGSRSTESFASSASAGELELSFPASWRRIEPTQAPALGLSSALALGAGGDSSNGALVAGISDADEPSLLASTLARGAAGAPTAVTLGKVQALRYGNVSAPGQQGALTVFAVPTSGGVATVTCRGSTASVARECEQIAATLHLSGGSAFPLAPSPSFAVGLSRVLSTLRSALTSDQGRLQRAANGAAQATAASQLATALRAAAASVAALPASPAVGKAKGALAAAVAGEADGYGALAGAAKAEDGAAYSRAVTAIDKARAAFGAALASFAAAGYTLSA